MSQEEAAASTSSEATVASTEKMITLLSKELEEFVIEERLALQSETIKGYINEEHDEDTIFPVPNVKSKTLEKVIEYWKHHIDDDDDDNKDTKAAEERKKFDAKWTDVDRDSLFELVLAANYLNTPPMLDLTCQTVADRIKHMKVEEVREYFGIENDFTPEEEKEIRDQNKWAFDE